MLKGPAAITFVKGDAAAVAKSLRDYARTNPLLVIKGGVLGEKVIDAKETTALAELPSREVLLAQLAGAIAAPMQQLAGLLQALPRNLAYGLAALRDKKEAEGGAPATTEAPAEAPAAEAAVAEPPVAEDAADVTAPVAEEAAEEAPAAETGASAAQADEAPPAEADASPAAAEPPTESEPTE
jgi:large subunit ribosomal protein L10